VTTPGGPVARHGLGDPRVPWVVLLDLAATDPPGIEEAADALSAIAVDAGWAPPSSAAVTTGPPRALLGALAGAGRDVVSVGLHDDGLVLAARHDALDGLAMLTVAGRLLGREVRSSARGVDRSRPGASPVGAAIRRAWEVAARPPARVARSVPAGATGDSFAATQVDGARRTADLVLAGARAVVRWNGARRARRVSVAVGVSTTGGASHELADRSAFLRLRGVERMDLDEVRRQLAQAPLQPGGGASSPALTWMAGVAVRLAAPRLGSTLLVSHLGDVTAPTTVSGAAFYPVTGGGSGLSLGAAAVHGNTVLTLRGRAGQHDDEGLRRLLALVVEELGARDQ
jgi:hypothetical protein